MQLIISPLLLQKRYSSSYLLQTATYWFGSSVKFRGVTVGTWSHWEGQFDTVKGKVHGGLTSLEKLKNILPQSQLSNVYRALVESYMRCADVIWGRLSITKKESLQRLQDRAISIIGTSRMKDEWSHNFLRTEQLVRLCPENLWNKFQRRSQYSSYNTGFCRDLQIPRYNLEYAKKGFSYSALKAWNEIPICIRELPTLCQFKKLTKNTFHELKAN